MELTQTRYTHTNLQRFAYTFSDNLLILKTSSFRMKSITIPTILNLEQWDFFIAFRISYSTNVLDCILRFRNVMGNMRRLLKIDVYLKKIARCIP